MEDSKTTATEPSPAMSTPGLSPAKNHSYHLKHHHRHHFDPITRNHQHNTGGLSFNSIVIIILSLVSVVIIFAIFLIIVMFRRLKSVAKHDTCNESGSINNSTSSRCTALTTINFDSSPEVKARCLYGGSVRTPHSRYKGVQVFTYKELEQATGNFSEMNAIGNGGFGVVYRGVLADGTMAAIKRLHRDGKQGERAFRMEVDLLSRLNCPYLVELLGYCADQHHRLLIYEFMGNGSLQQHLHRPGNQHRSLDWGNRNILLDENLRAKVSDFGLAKMGSDKIDGQISTRVLGTTGYLAPEYASKGKLTTKSDVYSYGVVLLQLLTGRVPIDINRPPGEHVLVSWALPRLTNRDKVDEMVDPAIQGQYSKKDLIQVAAIAAMCVQPEADYRPLMMDVVQSLIPLVKNFNSTNSSRFH
ncbi:hypothetical protein F3Y22_tig00110321pilonHSYRG00373 [Hibiscus syriacus]|uniref:Protein kinase domain-containing protein n=1 Tax=Hibiscus syriacus TaxID=106335 RepID=A0A6A3B2U6_HIBSY|nr:hypothetical protein F3Y22_tig00110321pilonHSYRG00373 [Hibiscus syriacus]